MNDTATTPTGEAGTLLTCTDPTHRHTGSAIIRHTDNAISQDRVCKLIDVAHHPLLSRADNVQRLGPWAV
jgi:hypothetical protein